MEPKDFTVPAANSSSVSFSPDAISPAPAVPDPSPWQRFLLFLRGVLAWWIELIDRLLIA